ncbi:hypothetical protein ACFQ0B_52845 [Nonomuraea thailandensis]
MSSRERPSPGGVLALLAAATATGSTGLAAGGTAGALLGAELAGTSAAAGLPVALLVVGSAAGAVLVSAQAGRGRRGRGLAIGYLVGVAGAIIVILAAVVRSVPLLLAGSVVLGVANSSVFMARYAALGVGSARGAAWRWAPCSSRRRPEPCSARCCSGRAARSPRRPGCPGWPGCTWSPWWRSGWPR